ncbi:hypothetical protein H1P_50027 [Hyella patelloides LEGE 07179]|uniref:Calcium-binding protein n=1 Tax=Hyella patelloides LEGE 07179 TaxID=945734 RepID=A0A563VZD1_9CYAN|nr:calcium-binding protein [Hyella patelloides]VEP16822.1 hypothetical protein H1P_50027 [Hyella patelloides LEGE 07179]
MFKNSESDYLNGGSGDDTLYGRSELDWLVGEEGNDLIYGKEGNEEIDGGAGNDLIFSGNLLENQQDTLIGGAGFDSFFLGEAPQGETITNESQSSFFLDILTDFSDLAFQTLFPSFKIAKEIAPIFIKGFADLFSGNFQTSETIIPASGGKYATVEDFNPLEDFMIIPVSDVDRPNVFLSNDTNGTSALTLKYDSEDGNNTFAAINFDSPSNILNNPNAGSLDRAIYDSMKTTLSETALFFDNGKVKVGLNGRNGFTEETNHINELPDPGVLSDLGTNKFMILGAYGPRALDITSGQNAADGSGVYLTGSNYNDNLVGYKSLATFIEEGKTEQDYIRELKENTINRKIYGFVGDDFLAGGAGRNIIDGGEGNDTVFYTQALNGIDLDLQSPRTNSNNISYHATNRPFDPTGEQGYFFNDLLRGIENVIGSDHDDIIKGNGQANLLTGGGGNDTLTGGNGADRFVFNSAAEGINTITDFSTAQGDKIEISQSGFGGITNTNNFSFNNDTLSFGTEQIATLQGNFTEDRVLNSIELI